MYLIFDVGNTMTNIVLSDENNNVYQRIRFLTNVFILESNFKTVLNKMFNINNINLKIVDTIIMSSVVEHANKIIENFAMENKKNFFNVKNDNFLSKLNTNILNKNEIASDCLCNIEYAKNLYKENVVIIDMGTITIFNIIGKKGKHLGEVFFPGLKNCNKSFRNVVNELKDVYTNIVLSNNVIGTTTKDFIQNGIYFGSIGMIKEIMTNIKKEMNGVELRVILTGGYSDIIINDLHFIDTADELATAKGAKIIYNLCNN